MRAYPLTLTADGAKLRVSAPDFPELSASGDDRDEAISRAVEALEETIWARIREREDIPTPSKGDVYATLPTMTTVKVMLYEAMQEQGIGKAQLARQLGWHLPQVDRVLNVRHLSRMGQMDKALAAVGIQLEIKARAITPSPAVAEPGSGTVKRAAQPRRRARTASQRKSDAT